MSVRTHPQSVSAEPAGAGRSTDDTISAAVRALAAGRGIRNAELAPILGINRASVFNKLKGATPWKASEVQELASYFGVSVGELFDGLGLFGNDEAPAASATGASDRVRHQGLEPRTR